MSYCKWNIVSEQKVIGNSVAFCFPISDPKKATIIAVAIIVKRALRTLKKRRHEPIYKIY